jgi:hypothetical protein
MTPHRHYRYLGPADLRGSSSGEGRVEVDRVETVRQWLDDQDPRDRAEPFTFVVTLGGRLRLAPRRSEHVVCAGGQDVLAAGEVRFEVDGEGPQVVEISNQSTGYCPDVDCWAAVEEALDAIGLRHPVGFTAPVVFRRCPTCDAKNVVRDDDYVCAVCDGDLPRGGT